MAVNKQLQFIKGSAVLILSNFVLKGINFLLLPLYTKYLSPAELGISDTITSLTSIVFPLMVMGLDSAFSAFFFDQADKAYRKAVFKTIWCTLFFASLLPIFISFFSPYFSELLFSTKRYTLIVGISLVSVSFNLWYLPFALLIRMENRMTLFAVINVVASLSMISLNIIFVSIFKLGVNSLIFSTAIVQLLQVVLYFKLGRIKLSSCQFDQFLLKKMLKFSLPLVPTALASWILTLSNRYILLYYCGEAQVGIYGIADRFGTIINLFANGIYMAYTTYAYDKKNDEDAKEQYARIFNGFSVAILSICFFVSLFGKEIIAIMADSNYKTSYLMLAPILYGQLLYGINTIVGYAMGFEKKSYYNFISTFIGACVNLFLCWLLIPSFGAVGAAYSVCSGFLVMAILTYIFAQRLYYVDYKINKMFFSIIITFCLVFMIQDFNIIWKCMLLVCSAFIYILVYRNVFLDYLNLLQSILKKRNNR